MAITNPYPWQAEIWQHLITRNNSGKLPHALLLTGQAGIGKLSLATYFAHTLLCEQPDQTEQPGPCGQCKGCGLIRADNHPDLLNIAPEAAGKTINVDRVRSISQFLNLTRHIADIQIVILAPADKMNKFAANSLLKTLEEPTSNTLLILITNSPGQLLPTIRSRCQRINCPSPTVEATTSWLNDRIKREDLGLNSANIKGVIRLANGSPLQALKFIRDKKLDSHNQMLDQYGQIAEQMADPLTVALQWKEFNVKQSLIWLMTWTMEMIRFKLYPGLSVNNRVGGNRIGDSAKLETMANQVELRSLFDYLDILMQCNGLIDSPLNQQLMLEDILIFWSRMNNVASKRSKL